MGKYFDYSPPASALDLSTGLSSVGDALTDVLNRRQRQRQFDEQQALAQQHEGREAHQFDQNLALQRGIDQRKTAADNARDERERQKTEGEAKLRARAFMAQGDTDSANIAMSTIGGKVVPGEAPAVGPAPQAPVAPAAPSPVPAEILARRRGLTSTSEGAESIYRSKGQPAGAYESTDPLAPPVITDDGKPPSILSHDYNPETQGARYQDTKDMIAEEQARVDQSGYDKSKAAFDQESAALPQRQADYERSRVLADNQRPYTLQSREGDPNAVTVTLGGIRHGGRELAAQDFLDSLNAVQLSPGEKDAAARAHAAILAGADPKTAIAAFQKERLLGEAQDFKHGENQFHEGEADKRAAMMAGFKGAQARLDTVRANEALGNGNRMDQGELRRDFSDWESKVAGLPLDSKAYKRLEFVARNINSGNALQQREAAEGLVGFFRGGVVTGQAQNFLLSHLSGLGGRAETAMEHIRTGQYGPQDLAVLKQAAENALVEQKDQVMRHYESAKVRYGQGSGFENLGSQVNAKVQGTLREYGVDVPPIYPDAAPAIPLGSTARPYQHRPRQRPAGAPPEVRAKDKARDSALDEAMGQ